MPEIPGIILAGGQSSRMGGGDKGLLPLGKQTVLDHVIEHITPQVSELALNANGDPVRFNRYQLPVVADSIGGFAGPLAGVLAGLDWAAQKGARHIVTVAADTPFFPCDLVAKLVAGGGEGGLSMAVTPDPRRGRVRHPTFGLWPVELRDDLRHALQKGLRKVVMWTKPHGCCEVMFEIEAYDPFFNVNTPQDMVEAERLLWEHGL